MGNCLTPPSSSGERKALPIDTTFKLPTPIPTWPPGEGFATETIDLGGLQVRQISSFTNVWATNEGGPGNLGATFFEPSPIPDGFFMLGCYSQPNNQPLFGWVLVGKDVNNDSPDGTLKKPIDYTLVWSSESLKIKQDGHGYIWLPTPPDGYRAIGHVVTNSPNKPSLEKIRCVRSDLTDQCETNNWIWGPGNESNSDGFNIYSLKPSSRGTKEPGVSVGTFIAQNKDSNSSLPLACLKNSKLNLSSMPNLSQIKALVEAYSPLIYFHPKETYLPSSVSWYFNNGTLLYKKGEESNPVPIEPTGSNLPQDGSNDGEYWLDLPIPIDKNAKEKVMEGNLQSSEAYLHIKPMLGATFTDIAMWIFYPFNGPGTAKLELIDIPLGRIGEHVGDWEHLTLRVSNFNGVLYSVYFSQHSGGTWVNASALEFQKGNKHVAYSSLHGHAFYPKPGLVLQGTTGIGIRNDTAKSDKVMDTGARYSVISAEHLHQEIVEPPWLNYARKWGPKVTYELGTEIQKVENFLTGDLKSAVESIVNLLPDEVLGEDGPTGPKMKNNWNGDEV